MEIYEKYEHFSVPYWISYLTILFNVLGCERTAYPEPKGLAAARK